jgi:hypothetical protein
LKRLLTSGVRALRNIDGNPHSAASLISTFASIHLISSCDRFEFDDSTISRVLFKVRFYRSIVDGSITRTFRRWKRLQVVPGNRYRQPFGEIEVVSAEVVDPKSISEHDAALSGYASLDDLLSELAKYREGTLYRIDFRFAGPDQRIALREKDDLSEAEIDALVKRLTRLDKASSHGPWTRQALELIDRNSAVVSTVLAAQMGLDRPVFKINIRKLKESGLTESLEVGYRLSPRGERLLAHLRTLLTARS